MGDTTATRELLDRALAPPRGLRVTFPSRERAAAFRNQCYAIRRKDAARSRRVWEPLDKGYGKSPYDELVFLFCVDGLWIGRNEPGEVTEL